LGGGSACGGEFESSHVAPRAFNEANMARWAHTLCDAHYKLREILCKRPHQIAGHACKAAQV
jgi:hypothetical protein